MVATNPQNCAIREGHKKSGVHMPPGNPEHQPDTINLNLNLVSPPCPALFGVCSFFDPAIGSNKKWEKPLRRTAVSPKYLYLSNSSHPDLDFTSKLTPSQGLGYLRGYDWTRGSADWCLTSTGTSTLLDSKTSEDRETRGVYGLERVSCPAVRTTIPDLKNSHLSSFTI